MIKTSKILENVNKFSIIYDGINFSDEPIIKMYIDFLINTYRKKSNVGYVIEVDFIGFKIINIVISYLVNIMMNEYKSENIINDLVKGNLVVYKGKRYIFEGLIEEDIGAGKYKYVVLSQDAYKEYIPIKMSKGIVPYYGGGKSLDGRGIKKDTNERINNLEKILDKKIEINPSVIDNCSVFVMDKHEAKEIMEKIKFKTKDDKYINFLDIATVSYYTDKEEYPFSGNVGKNEPSIKVTNTLNNARNIITDNYENSVTNIVIFGSERVEKNITYMDELINSSEVHSIVTSHISSISCEKLLDYCKKPDILAFTQKYVNNMEFIINNKNHIFKDLIRKINIIKNRTIKYEKIGEIIPIRDYEMTKELLSNLKKKSSQQEALKEFIIESYSLLKLFRTSIFTMSELEERIDNNKVGQRYPLERIKKIKSNMNQIFGIEDSTLELIVDNIYKMYQFLEYNSPLKEKLLEHLRTCSIKGKKNIAIIIQHRFYHDILYDLGIESLIDGKISFFTPNSFNNNNYYDEIIVAGYINGKRFEAFRNYNAESIIVIGYSYDERYVNYYKRKAEYFLYMIKEAQQNKVYKQKKIIDELIEKDQSLNEFIRNELNNINVNNYLSNHKGQLQFMAEAVIGATFTDGEKIFFSKDYSTYVYDSNKKNVLIKKAEKIIEGDILVFTKKGSLTKDIVNELLIDLLENNFLDKAYKESYKKLKRWKRLLKDYVKSLEKNYKEVEKNFKKNGINKNHITIKSWIDNHYHVTGPNEKIFYKNLGEILEDKDIINNSDIYWEATKNIRNIRTKILKIVGETAIRDLCGEEINDDIYNRINLNAKRIIDLMEIESISEIDPVKIPMNLINRPIEF